MSAEYTDIKNVKHKVEHVIASGKDSDSREQLVEQVFNALTRPSKRGRPFAT
jgi:hypothetical protein